MSTLSSSTVTSSNLVFCEVNPDADGVYSCANAADVALAAQENGGACIQTTGGFYQCTGVPKKIFLAQSNVPLAGSLFQKVSPQTLAENRNLLIRSFLFNLFDLFDEQSNAGLDDQTLHQKMGEIVSGLQKLWPNCPLLDHLSVFDGQIANRTTLRACLQMILSTRDFGDHSVTGFVRDILEKQIRKIDQQITGQ